MTDKVDLIDEMLEMTDEMCKECAFYNDCPLNYECPPKEIIRNVLFDAILESKE